MSPSSPNFCNYDNPYAPDTNNINSKRKTTDEINDVEVDEQLADTRKRFRNECKKALDKYAGGLKKIEQNTEKKGDHNKTTPHGRGKSFGESQRTSDNIMKEVVQLYNDVICPIFGRFVSKKGENVYALRDGLKCGLCLEDNIAEEAMIRMCNSNSCTYRCCAKCLQDVVKKATASSERPKCSACGKHTTVKPREAELVHLPDRQHLPDK